MPLLEARREAGQRNKRRRSAQQVQAGLRLYARYINEERLICARSSSFSPRIHILPNLW